MKDINLGKHDVSFFLSGEVEDSILPSSIELSLSFYRGV